MQRSVFELLEVNLPHDIVSNLIVLRVNHYRPILARIKPLFSFVLQLLDFFVFESLELHLLILGQGLDDMDFAH